MRVLRSALPLVAAALFTTSCVTSSPGPTVAPVQSGHFKILQMNDVYKIEGLEGGNAGGLARVRTLRKHLESDGSTVLLLHGGDMIFPSVMSKYFAGRPMIDVMNLLDGDGVAQDPLLMAAFGNHEFDNKDPQVLVDRLNESAFEWVASNTFRCNPECDQRFPKTSDVIVRDVGGVRVGVFGLLYPMKKAYMKSGDVLANATRAAQLARSQGASVVIALTHEDMADDVTLLKQTAGVDLVIGGHDHLFMQDHVGSRWVTKADADAKSVIVYDVNYDSRTGVHTTPLRVVVDQTIPKDPAVDARVQEWLAQLQQKLGGNETLGLTKNLLEGVEPAVRGYETALGNLLTDAARKQMQTDVAVLNAGSIRINDNIPPGPITKYDMEGVFYYKNSLVAVPVTGEQLLEMLRNAVSRADAGDGRFLQISGMSFAYSKQGSAYVVNPDDVLIGGKPLDLAKTYTVATIDYVYTNGTEDGYVLFSDATRPPKIHVEREADFRKTVEAYIREAGTIDIGVEGRIVRR